MRPALPIDTVIPALQQALRANPCAVLRAPTGAGKTTRVPPALLAQNLAGDRQIWVLQPRRVAARATARRMASELGEPLGQTIGYQVRFDRQTGPRTRILVMTEGVLLRLLHDDPCLERAGAVVFDEFHERNLASDVALAIVRRTQELVRPDLKIVVMSATLDPRPIAAYLGDCPTIDSEGHSYPVIVRYSPDRAKRPVHEAVADAVTSVLTRRSGDVLVFLPGVGEILRAARELESLGRRENLAILPLYGDLPPERQDEVLLPMPRRKLVLATNVAETSITIDGITAVIDSGLARIQRYDPAVGLDRLELVPISRASADQRSGRAGRTQAGECIRLWDQPSHARRAEFDEPEVRRVDLAGTVLQLLLWGERDPAAFPWFEPPREESLQQALLLLRRLDAVDESNMVTDIGKRIARLPVHPRLGRLLLEAGRLGRARRAALVAAMLSERDPFQRHAPTPRAVGRGMSNPNVRLPSQSDVLDRVAAIESFERSGQIESPVGTLRPGAAWSVLRVRDDLARQYSDSQTETRRDATLVGESDSDTEETGDADDDRVLMRALLAAFPDRLARRRENQREKGVMVGGRGVSLQPSCAVQQSELFLCVDVDAGRTETIVRQASAVQREWLPASRLRVAEELFFHPTQKRVAARRRVYWEDLMLEESPTAITDQEQCAEILWKAARAEWQRVFPADEPSVAGFLERARCLGEWLPELGLPTLDDQRLQELARLLCHGCRSLDELRNADWSGMLRGALTGEQLRAIERETPERWTLPNGNRVRIRYQRGKPPVISARIQELFGLEETPRLACGRVGVTLELLAPNMRPQQLTTDLASFWSTAYPKIRRELARRYPKHAWPENPRDGTGR